MREKLRKSGISVIGDVPWGTHICQFYRTKEDLLDILIPYFKAGLENNEFCLWVVSEPLRIEDEKESLRRSIPGIDTYLENGQIEIIPYTDWFTTEGVFDSKKVFNGRVEKLNRALDNGYDGMRLSGNTSWLEKESWDSFIEFKEQTDKAMGSYQLINLCTYPLDKHNAAEIIDVVVNHQFALIKREGKWKRMESAKRKQAEEAAFQATKNWEQTLNIVPDPIAVLDTDYRIVRINRAMAARLGMTPEDCVGIACYRAVHGTDEPPSFCPYRQLLKDGLEHTAEFCENYLNGFFKVSVSPLCDREGKLIGSILVAHDITELKEAEAKLREAYDNMENLVKERTAELEQAYKSLKESEKGLDEAQKMAHIGNWEWDILTDEAHWSDELYRIFGLSPQDPAPTFREYLSYVHPDDQDYVSDACGKAINGKPYSIDHRIILANGEERTIHKQSEVIFNEENNPIQLKGIIQDVTERKRAEQAIELSGERYRKITEQTGQLVYDYDVEKDTTDWAGNTEELTGFTPDEFKSLNLKFWLSHIHPEDLDRYKEKYDKYMESGDAYRTEYRFRKKNEEYIYIEDNGVCLRNKKGKVHRILGVIKDITQRKKAEISLANIETARKKEIHHRIKNNLQVISSLLDLQSEKFRNRKCVDDVEVMKAFKESQDRVMSIALIHEELHEGRGTDTLNFSPYLERLVKNLFQTYRLGNTNTNLNIELEEDIFLDMDIAVPLGIIINELVSNSLKYAFLDNYKGEIQIKLYREKFPEHADSGLGNGSDKGLGNGSRSGLGNGSSSGLGNGSSSGLGNRSSSGLGNGWDSVPGSRKEDYEGTNFILTVSDNGVGIPEDFNSEASSSLGLQLVMILVDQLGGELELKRDSGTEFVIRFAVMEKK